MQNWWFSFLELQKTSYISYCRIAIHTNRGIILHIYSVISRAANSREWLGQHARCFLWTVDFSGLRINYDFYRKPGALASCFARFGSFHDLVDLLTSLIFIIYHYLFVYKFESFLKNYSVYLYWHWHALSWERLNRIKFYGLGFKPSIDISGFILLNPNMIACVHEYLVLSIEEQQVQAQDLQFSMWICHSYIKRNLSSTY